MVEVKVIQEGGVAMSRVAGEIVIERPVQEVFDFIADERNEPKYNPQMLRSTLISDGPVGAGSRFAVVHTGRHGPVEMVVELTEYDRPTRLASTTTMPGFPIRGVLTFEPVGTATRMHWEWNLRLARAARLAAPLVKMIGARQERACWQGLKRHLEQSPIRTDSPSPG